MNNIPKEWKELSLEDICITKGIRRGPFGGALKKDIFVPNGYKVYEQKNAISKDLSLGQYFITEEKYNEMEAFQVKENDFLISCSGTIGKIVQISNNYKKGIINQALLKLTLNNFVINDTFFKYQFESDKIQSLIVDNTQGGAMANLVGMSIFKNIKFIIPPIKEQKQIAEILSTVDNKIENLKENVNVTEELKKGLIQKLFTEGICHTEFKDSEFGKIPKSWEEISLEDICITKGIRRGPFGGALKKDIFVPNGYKVYEQKNAISKDLSLGQYFITEEKYNEMEAFQVKENDFLISCSGTIGKIVQISNNYKKGIINQALLKLTLNNFVINDTFFKYQFESDKIQSLIVDNTQGGAMANLVGMSIFKNIKFIIPPIKEQKQIAEILSTVDNKIENLKENVNVIEELKKGLIQKLLTGEVRV